MSAHQKLEHAEHASHGDGKHGGGGSKIFGVTMGLIGVLIALSGAFVGSERNELTRAMIEQTQAHSDYTSASTKYRLVMLDLERQRGGSTANGSSTVARSIELATDYKEERNLAKNWAESFRPIVEAHFEAAEGYEHGQLMAEIAIVLASLAVLLASRPAWVLSVIVAVACLIQLGRVYVSTKHILRDSVVKVHHAEEAYEHLRKAHVGANQDELTIDHLDPDRKIRSALEARTPAHAPVAHPPAHKE